MEKCRGCDAAITLAYKEWWDESDDNACEQLGTHSPMIRIQLPPTPVISTSGPVVKWRNNRTNRIVPLSKKYNTRSSCIVIED
jgi:hypothetical protein